MKILFYRIGMFLCLAALAACTKPKPATGVLEQAMNKTLPAYLVATGKSFQYSPIKEVLGTTLPEGSYQIDISTKGENQGAALYPCWLQHIGQL